MKKIGLIIQGPLVSNGKSRKQSNIPSGRLNKSDLVEYDCRDNIKKIISTYNSSVSQIVISTWDN
jgi:hypothetical protein